jgi:hypothetical protein
LDLDVTTLIWIVPGIFGGLTIILLLYWLWLTVAPGPRPRTVSAPPPPPPAPAPRPRHVESDDTIIDRVGGPVTAGSMVIESGLPQVMTIDFPSSEFRIGRFRDETQNILVALDEKSISRSHALLRGNPQTGEYTIQDIGSRFGTFIVSPQGVPEQLQQGEARRVYNGTIVQFGSAVRARLNLPSGGYNLPNIPDDFDPGMTRL